MPALTQESGEQVTTSSGGFTYNAPPEEAPAPPKPPTPIGFDSDTPIGSGSAVGPGLFYRPGDPNAPQTRFNDEVGPIAHSTGFYYESDLDEMVNNFAGNYWAEIQMGLAAAGYLNGDFRLGVKDPKSKTAFGKLLETANNSNALWYDVLNGILSSPQSGPSGPGSSGSGRAAFVAQPPNREEVKQAYRSIRAKKLGGNWAARNNPEFEAEQEAFADSYEATVVGAQRAAYDRRSVEQPPSVESATTTRLEGREKAGLDANLFRQYAEVMTEALGGG